MGKEKFELRIRVPAWSKQTKISVNGMDFPAMYGYVSVDRTWSNGDCVDEPIEIKVESDNTVLVTFPEEEMVPYAHILEMEVPLTDGSKMRVTDYASAGKLWTEESKMAAWMLVKNV